MKNLVAFSLWGENPMYWEGALKNMELVKKYYPGFLTRFYIDKACNKDLIDKIRSRNAEIILVDSKDSFHGMFWRFWASEDLDVNIFLSRDCDSRITEREASAVREWLDSDKDFHIMRDHPYHTVPILGGMWGCRNGLMRKIKLIEKIEGWNQYNRKGIDQDFLGQVIYPLVKENTLEHSEFNLNYGGFTKKFPTERNNFEFVGDVFDENEERHPEYWRIIKKFYGIS